ncbi:MAG: Rieske (2Fe-2S) protein [Actinomycetota bacterium]|nr:Rieske (2Fe-2S) protein [Actinomycetota bacterium]
MSLALSKRLANSQPWLDQLADRGQPIVRDLVSTPPWLHDVLDGTWLGAPLHPALSDVPVGSWTGAFMLDAVAALTGSDTARAAADGALAIGVAGALPAAATGASDWRDLIGESRRVATLHAVMNVAGLSLNVASLIQRARDRRASARALSALALLISGTAAHLGGELSFGLGVRVNQTFAGAAPSDFVSVLDESELEDGAMRAVSLDGTPVLVTRSRSGELCAIANTCSHLGGPLADGSRDGDVVACPWHGSRFDVCSGRVVEGPAVFPQPVYEARVHDGKVELRARQAQQ